jgi:hypothetical protein
MRAPLTPAETPIPDLEKLNLIGPSETLLRKNDPTTTGSFA